MVKTVCNENIEDVLADPKNYVDETCDKPLVAVFSSAAVDHPTYIMIGYDEKNECFYLVVEDLEVSEDYYLKEGQTLETLFDELLLQAVREEI